MSAPDPTPERLPGRIITFYSYKGGVGRSMALANISLLLAQLGHKVLIVDWDLEAPGLDLYFRPHFRGQPRQAGGLLALLESADAERTPEERAERARLEREHASLLAQVAVLAAKERDARQRGALEGDATARGALKELHGRITELEPRLAELKQPHLDYAPFTHGIDVPRFAGLDILSSGAGAKDYPRRLADFSWPRFFEERNGAAWLASLRAQWQRDYDYVLIDSRTGVTDSSGVCTIKLPDELVFVLSPNQQNLEGCQRIIEAIHAARAADLAEPARLLIFPLLSRFDGRVETDLSDEWLQKCAESFAEDVDEWIDPKLDPEGPVGRAAALLRRTKLPHVPRYAFGEELSVLRDRHADPDRPAYYYSTVCQIIAAGFRVDAELLHGAAAAATLASEEARKKAETAAKFRAWWRALFLRWKPALAVVIVFFCVAVAMNAVLVRDRVREESRKLAQENYQLNEQLLAAVKQSGGADALARKLTAELKECAAKITSLEEELKKARLVAPATPAPATPAPATPAPATPAPATPAPATPAPATPAPATPAPAQTPPATTPATTVTYWNQEVDIDGERVLDRWKADEFPYVRIPWKEYNLHQVDAGDIVVVRDRNNGKVAYGVYAGSAGAKGTVRYAISKKLARGLGLNDGSSARWHAGEISFQIFPKTRPETGERSAVEIDAKGKELQASSWLPFPVIPYYPDEIGKETAQELMQKLSAPRSDRDLHGFKVPEIREMRASVPAETEVRYLETAAREPAWDVLKRLREIDPVRFKSAILVGLMPSEPAKQIEIPAKQIEIHLNRVPVAPNPSRTGAPKPRPMTNPTPSADGKR